VRHKRRGKINREIAFEMRISVSTVKRVWSYWLTQRVFANKKEGEKGEGAKRKGEGNNKRSKNEIKTRSEETGEGNRASIWRPHPPQPHPQLKKDWQRKSRGREEGSHT